MKLVKIKAAYYKQYDANYDLEVPAEGFGGWARQEIEIDLDATALVIMHAWDCGTREEYPGWYRHVEYIPRAQAILENVFPPLLDAVRGAKMTVFHVVGGGNYYKNYPGYKIARKVSGRDKHPSRVVKGKIRRRLDRLRGDVAGCGSHNNADIDRGFKAIDFPPQAKPVGDEGIAENAEQLLGLCKKNNIDHLVYIGFAINWCLLLSPGGMADMSKRGLLCSTIDQAVTAVENSFTAKEELCKKIALWRISLAFGFIFDDGDFLQSIS